jgi:hypothetical protein
MSTITSLPTPPSRQDPSNFNDRADAFLGALPTFVTETNTVAAEVNSSANAVIAATNVTKWISGNTYSQGAVVWSPINGLGYRRITAIGSGTTDPSLDTTNYKQVNGTGDVSTSGNQTISGVKVFNNNLGLGVTPSAWFSTRKVVQIGNASVAGIVGSGGYEVRSNAYLNTSGTEVYLNNDNATLYSSFSGQHRWYTAPSGTAGNPVSFTQAMTLDASGNLGIGTASPSARLSLSGTADTGIRIKAPSLSYIDFDDADSGTPNGSIAYEHSSNVLRLSTNNNTERARIDSSGNLLVGTTSSGLSNSNSVSLQPNGTSVFNHSNGISSGVSYITFAYNASIIGSITQNGTTAVAYNTSSDYRLKHDIAPMQGALARVQQLKPVTYKWNADGSDGEGFIAHELAEVCPQAVTGAKDAVDADGKPVYQGIDTSFLVATLTAAIQEQQAIITELRSRIEALESI